MVPTNHYLISYLFSLAH